MQLELTVGGDVSTFDELAFRQNLASTLPGITADDIRLSVTSGSVKVVATIITPTVQSTLTQVQQLAANPTTATATLGVTVEAVQPPQTVVTLIVSPPPSAPPAPPPSPPPFYTSGDTGAALANAQTASSSSTGPLTDEMLWVLIVVVIFICLFCGCYSSFVKGKREAKAELKKATAAAGLSLHPAQMAPIAPAGVAQPQSITPSATTTDDALRFIELGVQLERQRSGSQSPRARASAPSEDVDVVRVVQEVHRAAQNMNAAAENMNATMDARASAHLWLRDSLANTSLGSTPKGTPKGNHSDTGSDVAGRV